MERRERQPDMTKMAIAILQPLPTGLADARLARYSQSRIKGPVRHRFAVLFDIVDYAIGDFEDGLIDNILV